MKQVFILILISISSIIATDSEKLNTIDKILSEFSNKSKKELFKVYHLIFKKTYDLSTDYAKERFRIFKQNLKEIEEFNSLGDSHQKGIGEFTDLTEKEFEDEYLMNEEFSKQIENFIESDEDGENTEDVDDDDLTKRFLNNLDKNSTFAPIDYRGKLNPIKDQGKNCYGSWAFSAVSSVEFLYADKKLNLSEQELIDCGSRHGCKGGNPVIGLFEIKKNGLESTADYPYTGKQGECKYNKKKVVAKIDKVHLCRGRRHEGQEVQERKRRREPCGKHRLYKEFLSKGVSVVVTDAKILKDYKKGIIKKEAKKCRRPSYSADVVGYGVDSKNKEAYWIVRTSLGKNFGEKGYFRIAVDSKKGACFVEIFAARPSLKSKK